MHTETWTQKQDLEAEQLNAIKCLLGKKSSRQSSATDNQSARASSAGKGQAGRTGNRRWSGTSRQEIRTKAGTLKKDACMQES